MPKSKIINTIIYFSSKIKNLYKTKLLKLIYLLDEISVKETACKFSNLEYHVWKYLPVNSDLFYFLSFNLNNDILKTDIKIINNKYGEFILKNQNLMMTNFLIMTLN